MDIAYVICIVFIRKCQMVLQNGTILYSHQQFVRIAFASDPCQYLVWPVFINFSHFKKYAVVSLCSFNLHFLDEWWYWGSFQMCIDYYVSFLESACSFILPILILGCLYFYYRFIEVLYSLSDHWSIFSLLLILMGEHVRFFLHITCLII